MRRTPTELRTTSRRLACETAFVLDRRLRAERTRFIQMGTLRRKRSPPAFVRWLQLLFATVFASDHPTSRTRIARRLRRDSECSNAAPRGRNRFNDFAPTQVMKRTVDVVDERWLHVEGGVEVSEEDLETLPAELREAFPGGRHRPRNRGETAAAV